jgi:hypothetical protein
MTDEPSSKQPQPDMPGDADSGLLTAKELDEALAQASSLATDLSDQVGDADGSGQDQTNAPADLETELEEMERLASTTSSELVGGAGTTNGDSASDESAIPDFMSEFMEPLEPPVSVSESDSTYVPGSTDDGAPTVATTPRPGVIGTGLIGVVGTPPPARAEHVEESPVEIREIPPSKLGKSLAVFKWVGAWMGPSVCRVGLRAVRVLEKLDEPVSGMSQPVRRLIGWVAIATLGTSVVVYAISFF